MYKLINLDASEVVQTFSVVDQSVCIHAAEPLLLLNVLTSIGKISGITNRKGWHHPHVPIVDCMQYTNPLLVLPVTHHNVRHACTGRALQSSLVTPRDVSTLFNTCQRAWVDPSESRGVYTRQYIGYFTPICCSLGIEMCNHPNYGYLTLCKGSVRAGSPVMGGLPHDQVVGCACDQGQPCSDVAQARLPSSLTPY